MKVAFIIQGEGRGHQTQAVSLAEILIKNGHQVCVALVGTSDLNKGSAILDNCTHFDKVPFLSPSLSYNSKTNALSLRSTISDSMPKLFRYFKSLKTIKNVIETHQPDLIINFYDFLGGIFSGFLNRFEIPFVCVGHQYLLLNSVFEYPAKPRVDRFLVNLNSRITSMKSTKKLALSFRKFWSEREIETVPPLLRSEVKNQAVYNDNFTLVYVTQGSLIYKVIEQCNLFPDQKFEIFVDLPYEIDLPINLKVNPISNTLFLERMAASKGLISTAGFESVCEAMYLGKPVMMVPLKNHYEQLCNAYDGEISRAGIYSEDLNFRKYFDFLESDLYQPKNHKKWFDQSDEIIMNELYKIVNPVLIKA